MAFTKSRNRLAKELKIEQWGTIGDAEFAKLGVDRQSLADFERQFQGVLVFPWDSGYEQDRQVSNPAFQAYPIVIAYCEVPNDVKLCLAWAHRFGLWVTCRSGGHSTAGYSVNDLGMVIDTSRIKYVHVDPARMQAVVGAGTNFGTLNSVLDSFKLHVPGGGCEDVCVAGYMQGGGFGFTSREYGINCDNVTGVSVMLHDGRVVVANATQNQDLFWAIRGGTGDNFGVLLDITYQLHDLWQVWGFGLLWTMEDAPAALFEMQNNYMKNGAPPQLGYMTIITTQNGQKVLMMRGMYHGPVDEGKRVIDSLVRTGSPQFEIDKVGSYFEMNQYLLEEPYPIPDLPAGAKEDKTAGYIANPLQLSDWQRIIDYYQTTPKPYNTMVIEPYGGAINRYPTDGNAFIHRDVYMDLFLDVFWIEEGERPEAENWLNGFINLMAPYSNGHIYQNYPNKRTTDYRWAYWGEAFNSLLFVKEKYDPNNFFHFQQSISPYTAEVSEQVRQARSQSIFADQNIVYEAYSASVL